LYEKAAGATIRFCVPLVALIGIILFALRERLSPEMEAAGYILAYVACGLLLVHSAFYLQPKALRGSRNEEQTKSLSGNA
jgi:uncharacterized membrane protein